MDPRSQINTKECIEWDMHRDRKGYGRHWGGKLNPYKLVHRTVWEEEKGVIPEGIFVLHKCDNPPCINIEHLFLGTQKDNIRDCVSKGRQHEANRSHCPQGHPYDSVNTYTYHKLNGGSCRICRVCRNIYSKEAKLRRKNIENRN